MIRFKRKRNITNPFPIVIGLLVCCCIVSVILSFLFLAQLKILSNQNSQTFVNEVITKSNNINIEEEIETDNNTDISVSNRMKKMVNFGFYSFIKNCPEADEIRPSTSQCIQNFGFQSTIFESLESLFLLNLSKSYKMANEMVLNHFKKDNHDKFLVRSELFNRVAASLIGAYLLSKDKSLLNMTEQLIDSIMFIDSKSFFPYPIINFNLKKGFDRSWENGTSIIDIVSGLPEILSLYEITKKIKYLNYAKDLLGKIKKSNNQLNKNDKFQLFVFYDSKNGVNATNDLITSQNSVFFKEMYESLLKSYYLVDLPELNEILPESIISGQIINEIYFDSFHFTHYFNHSGLRYKFNYDVQDMYKGKFEFDALLIRNKIRNIAYSYINNQTDENNLNFKDRIEEFVDKILDNTDEKCKSPFGYSGLSYSNSKKQRKNNIQHSSFFGNWINSLSQALNNNISFWEHALFNTRGHLLYVK